MKDTQRGQIKSQGTLQGRISSHIADEVHCTERLDEKVPPRGLTLQE